MPNAMVAVLAFVLITYGIAEILGASGAIAALTLGFVLSNRVSLGVTRLRVFDHVADLREPRYVALFLADAIFLLKTFFFLYLGISVQVTDWRLGALAVGAVAALYATRAVVVRLTMPTSTSRWDASVMTVMGPKGLAAAVLAGVPIQMGLAQGEVIQQFTYMLVLASIVVTSAMVPQLSRGPVGALMARVFGGFAESAPAPRPLEVVEADVDELRTEADAVGR